LRSIRTELILTAVLIALTVLVYHSVNHYPFGDYDDPQYVSNNPQVQQGLTWDTVRWAFTTYYDGIWHPVTWLSHALDCQLFAGAAGDHHDVNLALHALNAVILFWVLLRATGFSGRSFAAGALFAVHPINVESVAWIAERKNLLSMFFFLLALGAYRWYALASDRAQRTNLPVVARYCVVAVLYALAALSKVQVITFPCVLLLWDYWPLRRVVFVGRSEAARDERTQRSLVWLLVEKVPLFLISIIVTALSLQSRQVVGVYPYPVSLRIEYALTSYVQYLGKAFWPAHLAAFYPHPDFVSLWRAASATMFLTVLTWLVFEARERHPYLLIGWLFYLGTMVPMLGLSGLGYAGRQGIADRYAYVPLVGVFIMICWGIAEWSDGKQVSRTWLRATCAFVLLVLGVLAYRQVGYWRDSMSLWSHALAVTDRNWFAEDKVGLQLSDEGKHEEALPYFQRAQALKPDDYYSNLHIGMYKQSHGDPKGAIQLYTAVINSPWTPLDYKYKAFSSMCYAYRGLGDSVHEQKCFTMLDRLQRAGSR
jgi:hypothetical protein